MLNRLNRREDFCSGFSLSKSVGFHFVVLAFFIFVPIINLVAGRLCSRDYHLCLIWLSWVLAPLDHNPLVSLVLGFSVNPEDIMASAKLTAFFFDAACKPLAVVRHNYCTSSLLICLLIALLRLCI